MSIFNRISDIVNANINIILEQAEDPEKLVRLITQEMEETLVEVRSASARYLADKKNIQQTLTKMKHEVDGWQSKAEVAISRGRDDLAKAALLEKSRFDTAVTTTEADLIHMNTALQKLASDAGQLQEKLQTARTRQKALILRGQTAKSGIKVKRQIHDINVDDAFGRFESYERKLDEMEGEIESYDLGNQGLTEQIQELEQDDYLTAELDALKSRMSNIGNSQNITPRENG